MIDQIASAIAPVFVLILLGAGLRRVGWSSESLWDLINDLVYLVLMPSLLFHKLSSTDLPFDELGAYAMVMLGGFFTTVAVALAACKALRFSAPVTNAVFQGASRQNTFIVLALAEGLLGATGLTLAALAAAILVSATNVTVMFVIGVINRRPDAPFNMLAVLRSVIFNPFILSIGFGMIANLVGFRDVPVIHPALALLGSAALPLMLIATGAGLRQMGAAGKLAPLTIAIFCKLALYPVLLVGLGVALGLSHDALIVAALFGVVPTAASSYVVTRKTRGDAPLIATIATTQTLIAFVTAPLTIMVVEWWF